MGQAKAGELAQIIQTLMFTIQLYQKSQNKTFFLLKILNSCSND